MPIGMVGTTAWALLINVANPVPSSTPHANMPVHFKTEEECSRVSSAINAKSAEAGMQKQMSARCAQIEYVQMPKESGEKLQKSGSPY